MSGCTRRRSREQSNGTTPTHTQAHTSSRISRLDSSEDCAAIPRGTTRHPQPATRNPQHSTIILLQCYAHDDAPGCFAPPTISVLTLPSFVVLHRHSSSPGRSAPRSCSRDPWRTTSCYRTTSFYSTHPDQHERLKTISILLATIIAWRCIGEVHDSSVLAGALSLSTTVVLRVTGAEEKA